MPTVFGSLFARTAAVNLIRQFGEPVGYYNRAGDPVRTISAIVERNELQIISETGEITGQSIVVRVLTQQCYYLRPTGSYKYFRPDGVSRYVRPFYEQGILAAEVDTGGDQLSFPLRVGDVPKRRSIVRVLSDSAGILRLLCQ